MKNNKIRKHWWINHGRGGIQIKWARASNWEVGHDYEEMKNNNNNEEEEKVEHTKDDGDNNEYEYKDEDKDKEV